MKNLKSLGAVFPMLWLSMAPLALASEGSLLFQMKGEPVALPEDACQRLCGQIESVIVSSSIDSKHFPRLFKRHRPPSVEQIPRDSFLKVEYPEAKVFKNANGELQAREVWIIFREGENYPGPIYLVNEGSVVALWKYSGIKLVGLMADETLRSHLPERMQKTAAKAESYVKGQPSAQASPQESEPVAESAPAASPSE